MSTTNPAPTATTFNFIGAFEALVFMAAYRRPGQRKQSTCFPEIHEVCLDRSAVIDYLDLPGTEARRNRCLDSIERLSAAYGWSVDSIIRVLDRFTTA